MKPNPDVPFVSLESVKDRLNPFVVHLLAGETRWWMHDLLNACFDDKQVFVCTKTHIHLPWGLPTVEHEISHAVEMKDQSRWLLPDWGMKFGKTWGRKPAGFFAGMAREQRARAISLHLLSSQNEAESSIYNLLNNVHGWGDPAKDFLPYGRFKTYQHLQDWVHTIRATTYKAWSKERIEEEWKIRLRAMQDWMETK
jgi:hypothetical protein